MVSQPVLAVLMLFPVTDASEKAKAEEDTRLRVSRYLYALILDIYFRGIRTFTTMHGGPEDALEIWESALQSNDNTCPMLSSGSVCSFGGRVVAKGAELTLSTPEHTIPRIVCLKR